ncbi:hypothetical protein [Rhodobacter sp. CZR27]|uniref:hypothetical protein n=1 Tax=Rhodobacter sp. CZR27 TaxID=2033869 RepID=UPI000BBE98DB|nr:hypothetical protein [Rhodobacter sp. CZR27]
MEPTIGFGVYRFTLEIYRRWFFVSIPMLGEICASPVMVLTFDPWSEVPEEAAETKAHRYAEEIKRNRIDFGRGSGSGRRMA